MKPHPVDTYVGKRLRTMRTLRGLSQESLGDKIGVSFQQIQKYERGINRMGSSRLYEFGKILGVAITYFFEGFEADNSNAASPYAPPGLAEDAQEGFAHENLTSRETLELVRAYYKIKDPAVRKKISDLVRSLSEAEAEELLG